VQGFESKLFCSYFAKNGGVKLLEGGIESGFNHVTTEVYMPRLLHLKGRKNVRVVEVRTHILTHICIHTHTHTHTDTQTHTYTRSG
jgi:hypothetical protein